MVSQLIVSLIGGSWYRSLYKDTEQDARYQEVVKSVSKFVDFVNPSTVRVKGDGVFVGRDSSNGIVIDNGSVSKKHCMFIQIDAHWAVQDLGSTNGTFTITDGRQTRVPKDVPVYLLKGDMVMLGTEKSKVLLRVDW